MTDTDKAMKVETAPSRKPKLRPTALRRGTPIPLDAIIEFIDWQIEHYEGDDRQSLIAASNAIYDHLHKDAPDVPHGN